jgi:cbb3-type cytochrome c oxidase subunit III
MPGGPLPKGPASKGAASAGKIVFEANCVRCHGPKGEGRRPGLPNFADAKWQKAQNDAELLGVIRNGKDKMPKFQDRLSDQQITDVESYVRTLGPAK